MDLWELISVGKHSEALQMAERTYRADERGVPEAINLAACYMYDRQWEATYTHFCHFTEVYRYTIDSAFKFTGVAKWCERDQEAAVAEWRRGVDVDYADIGGGMMIPLHLFFAAAMNPELLSIDEPIDLLRNRMRSKSRTGWPIYLARIVLGETSRDEAIEQIQQDVSHFWGDERRQAEESALQSLDFWCGVKRLSDGDTEAFINAARSYGDLSWSDFDRNRDVLIDKLREPAFYLARFEAERAAYAV